MRTDEVESRVRREIERFRYEPPCHATIGVPWSRERVASEVELLRASLITPQVATVEIADVGSPGPERDLWIVTKTLENGYLIVFDAEGDCFGLAVRGEIGIPQTLAIWGDLVHMFMSR